MRKLLFLTLTIILLTGCTSSTKLLEESLSSTAAAPQAVGDTGRATNTPQAEGDTKSAADTPTSVRSTETPDPTSTPTSEPTPTVEIRNIELVKTGFGQEDRSLAYAFLVSNPNSSHAIENSQYQIAAYDSEDLVLETASGYINLLLPQQEVGIAGEVYLDTEGLVVDHVDVQIKPGDYEPVDFSETFTSEKVRFVESDYSDRVLGVVTNPFGVDLRSVGVYAVAYSADETIIGGGHAYVDFIPAGGQAAASVSITVDGDPSIVEMYGSFSGLTRLLSSEPSSAETNLEILEKGFGQDGSRIGYAFVIENLGQNHSIEDSNYQVAAYDAEGFVVGTDSGYITLILPGQELAVAGTTYLTPESAVVDRFDVQILPGEVVEAEQQPTFSAENVSFAPSDYSPSVKGVIVSPYKKDISDLKVYAVAYNAEGAIIGGGYTYLDFAPAEGKAAVEVSIEVDGTPTSVELYATVSGLSE